MRVAVTGSAGRIGASVVADLAGRGHQVTGLDLRRGDHPGVRHLAADLTDAGHVYSGLAGAEAVVHLGAWSGTVPDTEVYAANTAGAFNVLRACADLGIRRVVTASSAQVYGFKANPPVYVPVDEDHPLRPQNSYALAKIASEEAAEYFCRRHGLEAVTFRFMGIRRPEEVPPQIEILRADPASGVGLLWTRTDVRDAARACTLAVEAASVEPGVYNLTGRSIIASEDTAVLVERLFGAATEVRAELPGRSSPMSCARAEAAFGWRPAFVWTAGGLSPERGHATEVPHP